MRAFKIILLFIILKGMCFADDYQLSEPKLDVIGYLEITDTTSEQPIYYDISSPDGKIVYLLGYNGIGLIRKSVDKGQTWQNVYISQPGQNNRLYDIETPSKDLIIAVGDSGKILRSIDGGNNWNTSYTGYPTPIKFIRMYDSLHGLIGILPGYKFLKTSNGGEFWDTLQLPPEILPKIAALTALVYKKNFICFTLEWKSEKYLYLSNDNGLSFKKYDMPDSGKVNDMKLLDNGFIIVTTSPAFNKNDPNDKRVYDHIFVIDTAKNGNIIKIINGLYQYFVSFGLTTMDISNNNIICVGNGGKIFFSNDFGKNWLIDTLYYQNIDRKGYSFRCVKFIDNNIALIGTGQGDLLKFTIKDKFIGVDDYNMNINHLHLYPNPAKDEMIITIDEAVTNNADIKIYNSKGLMIKELNTKIENNLIKINVSDLPSGMYYLKIINGVNLMYEKFIVNR